MARQRGIQDAYTGQSGQSAVMSELLIRLCNVAVPVVDAGTDLFAFLDERVEIARVQVKAAQAERYKRGNGHRAQFDIPLRQLEHVDDPRLYYALAVRLARIIHNRGYERVADEHKAIDHHDLCRSFMTEQRKQSALAGTGWRTW